MRLLPVFLMLGACQHTGALVGPNPNQLVTAIRSAPVVAGAAHASTYEVRSLSCRVLAEDPSEFVCRFQAKEPTGAWRTRSAIVAADGGDWVLLSLD